MKCNFFMKKFVLQINESLQPSEIETVTNNEQTNGPESTNNEQQNDGSVDGNAHFDILYEPLSPNTDEILQALDEAYDRQQSSESREIHAHDQHTMGESEAANNPLDKVRQSKRLATRNDNVGGKRKKIVHEKIHVPNSKVSY